MDIDFLDDEFKIEEIDDLTLSQVCDEMEAFDGLLNMSLTQTLAEYETGLDHDESTPNISECSVFPETSATVHSEEEPMSKRPRLPFGEFKNCNITFQF
uniref:Uncharacterized protein n=1 Tax=Magallana gigas TaxID=29159 RepID=A0A8W8NEH2_MAGGI